MAFSIIMISIIIKVYVILVGYGICILFYLQLESLWRRRRSGVLGVGLINHDLVFIYDWCGGRGPATVPDMGR